MCLSCGGQVLASYRCVCCWAQVGPHGGLVWWCTFPFPSTKHSWTHEPCVCVFATDWATIILHPRWGDVKVASKAAQSGPSLQENLSPGLHLCLNEPVTQQWLRQTTHVFHHESHICKLTDPFCQANIGKRLQCPSGWWQSRFLVYGPNFSNLHSCTFGFVWNQTVPSISVWTQLFLLPDVEGVGGFSRCQGTLQEVWCPRNRLQLFLPFWWHSASSYSSRRPAAVCLLSGWIRTPHSCLLTGLD